MTDFSKQKWVRAGWQGLTFELPEEWNIGAIGGEKTQGYLRFDDSDMPRMEIKWADAGKSFIDIPGLVDKYLKDLQKGKKKDKPEVSRDTKLVSKRKLKGKKSLETFSWKSETQGFGAAWYCPDCHRTVIIQVMGKLDEPVQELAERVILGTEDHTVGDWAYWSAYGFGFEAPADFVLSGQKLMAGLIEVTLDREGERLTAARWGMANVVLKRTSLEEWGKKELAKRIKKFSTDFSTETYRGHQAIVITGRSNLPQEKIQAFVQHVRGKDFPDRVRAILWHCEDDNKLFYVEGIMDREHVGLVDEMAGRIACHEGGAEL
ncbi:MAG: hypothetical protein ABFD96_14055 [Armatimonadia bacterium]